MEIELWGIVRALLLLTVANGAPVIAKKLLGTRFAHPVDGGSKFVDGKPLLGRSKTWRGIAVSVGATAAVAPLLGLSPTQGVLLAALAMTGDLFSSFVKRRLGLPSSAQAIGLDQVPECLLPLLACRSTFALAWTDVALATGLFLVGELIASRVLFMLHVRDRPY